MVGCIALTAIAALSCAPAERRAEDEAAASTGSTAASERRGHRSDGTEGHGCYGDGTCNADLICQSGLCIVSASPEPSTEGGAEPEPSAAGGDATMGIRSGDFPPGTSLLTMWAVEGRVTGEQTATGTLPDDSTVNAQIFATSSVCAGCHANQEGTAAMRDTAGRPVAPYDLWRASMKANAARDPIFRAVLSQELTRAPAAAAAIEAICLGCHTPMAVREAEMTGQDPFRFADLFGTGELAQLGVDGVSCAVCHQIAPDGLGDESSFGAGYVVSGERRMYGPHANPFVMPMEMQTGFTPTQADHMTDSALCGACHTLETHAIAEDGTALGAAHQEQAPYLEWRNSVFNTEGTPGDAPTSCQSCHVPTTDEDGATIHTHIAKRPPGGTFPMTAPRSPYGRHLFLGGNTLVPQLLRDEPSLNAAAPPEAFDAAIAVTEAQLMARTAALEIQRVEAAAGGVELELAVKNLTGHKFPTAYPSRRAFLRVRAHDASGARVFSSGEFDLTGRLLDDAGKVLRSELLGGAVLPHYERIESTDQVQVYESVMSDSDGATTFSLLAAVEFIKDNRLLPRGYDPGHADADRTAPHGLGGDTDFAGGEDRVVYALPASTASVEVTLYFQVAGARWLRELLTTRTPSTDALANMLGRADLAPVAVAQATVQVP